MAVKTNKCACAYCANRETEDCGRYPEFIPEGKEGYDEDWFTDCEQCDGGCPVFFCAYFEPKDEV